MDAGIHVNKQGNDIIGIVWLFLNPLILFLFIHAIDLSVANPHYTIRLIK